MRHRDGKLQYPVTLTPAEEGGFVITMPDIPEAISQAETREEALEEALRGFISAMEFYRDDGRPVPEPSTAGEDFIEVPVGLVYSDYRS